MGGLFNLGFVSFDDSTLLTLFEIFSEIQSNLSL